MQVKISFKHLGHTESLDQRIMQKSKRLEKYLDGNTRVHWTCEANSDEHKAEIKLIGSRFEYHASASSEDLYKSLDMVINKIEKQLSKQKNKWKNRINRKNKENSELTILDPEQAWISRDHDEEAA